MTFKYGISSICGIVCCALSVSAQSLLSINYPLGLPVQGISSHSRALGGTGTGVENDFFGVLNNPANLAGCGKTVFSVAAGGNLLLVDNGSIEERYLSAGLSSLMLSIPFGRYGALGIAVEPAGSFNARYRQLDAIDSETARVLAISGSPSAFYGDSMETGLLRSGDALAWQVGWGYNVLRKAHLGVGIKRYNLTSQSIKLIRMHGAVNRELTDSTFTAYATNALRGGLIVPVKNLTLGMCGEYYFVAKGKSVRTIWGTRDTSEQVEKERFELKPPPSLSLGCSYQFNQQWMAAADAGLTLWKRFHDERDAGESLDNSFVVSGGVQFIPAPNLLKPRWWEITQYCGGLRYAELPGAVGAEYTGTLGVGLPMQSNDGVLDIVFEGILRRDSRFSSRENSIGIKIGLNGGRKWYQSGKDSY